MFRESWSKTLLCISLAVIFVNSFNPFKESDSFYHIKTGEVIWQTKQIPQSDIFSLIAYGAPWVTHEWLAEVIFYFIFGLSGFWGVMAFVAALSVLTYYLVYKTALEKGAEPHIALFFLLIFSYLTLEVWIARPQIFAYFSFAALLFLLERYRKEGKRIYFFLILADIIFWANVHASFILGLAVLALFAGLRAAAYLSNPKKAPLLHAPVLFVSALAISFLNPNGYKVFWYSQYIKPAVEALGVMEWKSILDFLYVKKAALFLGIMLIGDALVAWQFVIRKKSRDWMTAGIVFGVSILPLISIRHVAFWPLAATVPIAAAASPVLRRESGRIFSRNLVAGLAVMAVLFLAARVPGLPRKYFNGDTVPVYAADFIERTGLKGPMFNLYNEGGYFIFRLWPEEKVFIDGRSEVYPGRPLRDFMEILRGDSRAQQLVDEYKINFFVLSYRPDEMARSLAPLYSMLLSNGWKFVYWDDTSLILVKDTAENRGIIETYAMYHIGPFREPSTIPDQERRASLAEMRTLLEQFPESKIVQEYARSLAPVLPVMK
jgi:hypothetical protein